MPLDLALSPEALCSFKKATLALSEKFASPSNAATLTLSSPPPFASSSSLGRRSIIFHNPASLAPAAWAG